MKIFDRVVDHWNVTVPNLEEALAFYVGVLGFREEARFFNNGMNFVFVTDGNMTYELLEKPEVTQTTFDHVAYVSEDIQADYEAFKKEDPSLLMGEIGLAEGLFEHGMYYFFIKGCHGERVEFCQKKQA